MATQYSNKPIVTDGLVYALDFGNQRSYVSGSTTANNLLFSPFSASINAGFDGTAITFTGSQTALTNFSPVDLTNYESGSWTAMTTIKLNTSGYFMGLRIGNDRFITQLSNRSLLLNYNLGKYSYPKQYEVGRTYAPLAFSTGSYAHLTLRGKSGSIDFFVNGIPVPANGTNGNEQAAVNGSLSFNGVPAFGTNYWSGSLANYYFYNRALTSDEIYSNYLLVAQRYGLPTIPKPYTIDENAFLFLSQSGITDPIITSSIDTFVRGLKSASLWEKMFAIYPFVGTGSAGVNLTGSQRWNLKEPGIYGLTYSGTWNGSTTGSAPSGSNTFIQAGGINPSNVFSNMSNTNTHISILSYDTPVSSSYLMGTGMTEDLAVSTLAGDYGTPAAAYSVRKVRTAYSGALMDVRRSLDNVTSSIGYISNGDLDTGSLLDWVVPGRNTLPGAYSGLAAAYSLRRVSSSYSGFAIDVRRDSDNTTSSIGFNATGGLDTGTLLAFVTGSANTGSGFVAQWYDQSGNGRHATQTTASNQPLIVSSGSLVTENGRPTLRFDGIDDYLKTSTFGPISQPYTTFTHVEYASMPSFPYLVDHGSEIGLIGAYNVGGGHRIYAGANLYFGSAAATNTPYLYYGLFSGSNSAISINGATATTGNAGSTGISFITLGSSGIQSPGTFFSGSFFEHLEYYADQSTNRPLIENNINNYYNIYTGSNHGFVARWYDQSGNSRHASQTATGSQPLIVLSGSVVSSGTRPSLYWKTDGNDNLLFSRVTNIQTVFHISQLAETGSTQSFILGDNPNFDYHAGDDLPQKWLRNENTVVVNGSNFINGVSYNFVTTNRNLNRNLLTLIHTSAAGRASRLTDDRGIPGRSWRGYIQEITLYSSSQASNREAIEYGINSYYNIYPQTSSFATSSFAIYTTSGSVSASLNNELVSGISSTGPLGLITVSRTGSNSLTIARNGVTSSFAVPASGALSTGLYLGAVNNNGIALGNSPMNISFASVGTGLTGTDIQNYERLTWGLQYNLGRNRNIVTQSLVLYLDASNRTSYPGSGNTWFDLSGNNNNGTLINGPTFSTSNEGSIVFDGSDDYVQVPNNAALNSNIGTISIWFRPSVSSLNNAMLIGKTDSSTSTNGINIIVNGDSVYGQLKGSSFINLSGSLLTPNTWNNYTVTYISGVSYSSYLNGSLIGSNTLPSFTFSTQPLRIARSLDAFWAIYKGEVASTQIYNRALSAQEVLQNFNATRGRFGV